MRGGVGVKGRLEFFRKFIRFGRAKRPLEGDAHTCLHVPEIPEICPWHGKYILKIVQIYVDSVQIANTGSNLTIIYDLLCEFPRPPISEIIIDDHDKHEH